jgi:hypothetical protein
MQQPQHHHHKPKPALSGSSSWIRRSPPPSPPHKKPWGAGGRGRYACRLVPLLVLTLYSLFTVLRIPSSSLVVNTADSGAPRPPRLEFPPRFRRPVAPELNAAPSLLCCTNDDSVRPQSAWSGVTMWRRSRPTCRPTRTASRPAKRRARRRPSPAPPSSAVSQVIQLGRRSLACWRSSAP